MQYWILQAFLTSREKPPIIEFSSPPRISKQDYLRQTFGKEISFEYRKRRYLYRFYSEDEGVMAAVIGRPHTATLTPREGFQSVDMTDWETANVLIDTSGDADGQKIAMQRTAHVRNPLEVFRALADFINHRNADTDWTIAVNAVSEKNEFWSAVRRYSGTLTELELVYIPPNVWGGQDETAKALKKLHSQTNNDEVDVRIRNADGKLDLGGDIIKESVEYVTGGGGRAALRVGKKKVFDTVSAVVTESPDVDIEVQQAPKGLLRALADRLLRQRHISQ